MRGSCLRIDAPGEFRSRLPRFDYHAPRSLPEACRLLADLGPEGLALGGGTDLLVKLSRRVTTPRALVALKRIPELGGIAFDVERGLRIGAATLLAEVAEHPDVRRHYPAIAGAAAHTATVQVRNMGTIGGNLANASPCADNVPALLALDAAVLVAGPTGSRRLPLGELFAGPGLTRLGPGEILEAIEVGPPGPGLGAAYERISARSRVDLSAVSVGVALGLAGGRVARVGIALGSVAPTVIRVPSAEALLRGEEPTAERIAAAAEAAAAGSRPISDLRGSAAWRREMVRVLTRRALARARDATRGGTGS